MPETPCRVHGAGRSRPKLQPLPGVSQAIAVDHKAANSHDPLRKLAPGWPLNPQNRRLNPVRGALRAIRAWRRVCRSAAPAEGDKVSLRDRETTAAQLRRDESTSVFRVLLIDGSADELRVGLVDGSQGEELLVDGFADGVELGLEAVDVLVQAEVDDLINRRVSHLAA